VLDLAILTVALFDLAIVSVDMFNDPKLWVAIGTVFVAIVTSWAVNRRQVGINEQRIEKLMVSDADNRTAIALLKQEQQSHGAQIRELVLELRVAVKNLQLVAIDLATGSKRGNNA